MEVGSMRVGVVGCGRVSAQYFESMGNLSLDVVAVADALPERAQYAQKWFPEARRMAAEELIADELVDIVVNLTQPSQHWAITETAVNYGKYVWSEKPLDSHTRDFSKDEFDRYNSLVGCAPDTILSAGFQSAKRALMDNVIGMPLSASAHMVMRGHESWHPDPAHYYRSPGGGPLDDMGPYYLSALVQLLGPVTKVSAESERSPVRRRVAIGERAGEEISVEVDTTVALILRHAGGALSTLLLTFDTGVSLPGAISVYGTHATMILPDPNTFDNQVGVVTDGATSSLPLLCGYRAGARGVGVNEIARRPDKLPYSGVSFALARHIVAIIDSAKKSVREGSTIALPEVPVVGDPMTSLL